MAENSCVIISIFFKQKTTSKMKIAYAKLEKYLQCYLMKEAVTAHCDHS